jgi:hypothetical protein
MATEQQLINNSLVIYGDSRSGKTTECRAVAWYIWEKYGLKTRYITCDGGGLQPLADYVEAGLIDAIDITGHDDFLLVFRALSDGQWRVNGKWVPWASQTDKDQVGLYIVESIASVCEELMQYYVRNGIRFGNQDLLAKQVIKAQTPEMTGQPQETVASANMTTYMGISNEIFERIRSFRKLLNLGPKMLVWTSQEASGSETLAGIKRSSIGIGAIGQAITPTLPKHFGDMVHIELATLPNKQTERRAYFTPHADPELGNREWKASLRLTPVEVAALIKDPEFKNGYVVLTPEDDPLTRQGFTKLFRWRDQLQSTAADKIRARMAAARASAKAATEGGEA